MALHHNVEGSALHVVACLCAADLSIVAFCPICRVNCHRSAEVVPDGLEFILHEVHVDQDLVRSILAPELAHLEVCAELLLSVYLQRKLFYIIRSVMLIPVLITIAPIKTIPAATTATTIIGAVISNNWQNTSPQNTQTHSEPHQP